MYSVDTRLRPSGEAGLLVSHIDAFSHYQSTQAWTWEHQALLKARVLLSDQQIKFSFNQLKHKVLFLPRDIHLLREDVQDMRVKIKEHSEKESIKHMAGGLLDLEFLVQFLALAYPQNGFVRATHPLIQLKLLHEERHIDRIQYITLKRIYRHYHQVMHARILRLEAPDFDQDLATVQALSQILFYKSKD